MTNLLSSLARSATFSESDKQATQKMLRTILYIVIAVSLLISILDGILFKRLSTLYALGPLTIISLVSLYYLQREILWPARIVIPLGTLVAVSYIIMAGNGLHDVGISSWGIVIILAGLTLGENGVVVFGVLSALAVTAIGIAERNGLVAYPFGRVGISDIAIISIAILGGAFLLRLLLSRFQHAILQLQRSEQDQINANAELVILKESLEKRVIERTEELESRRSDLENANQKIQTRASQFEALAQVTQSITSIRDLRELLPRIATVISEKFGFYHVGVFLIDEINEYAVLSATNSDGGRKMMERKHRLQIGAQGIVGNVTSTGIARIAMDVGKEAIFFDNPELPETHSEMALPLKSGDEIIGALDVQSTERGAFTDEDIQMLSLLANQVSLAIENARLFDETRKALAESEAASRQTIRDTWRSLPAEHNLLGYRYSLTGVSPLDKPIELSESPSDKNNNKQTETVRVVVPIELRGETIGSLVVQSPSMDEINQDQLDLIKAVAERVAISAENARLFDETIRRAERERMVSDITGKIRSVNDPQAMIQTAIEELRNALGATRVEVVPQTIKGAE